jgi:predicted Ser/Thr protein kinase
MSGPPRVGTTFAGYRVERVLGRGGMSVVYLAEHPRLKSAVALKLLAPELAADEGFRERLLRESRLAASISHPNVIPVYDTGEEEGTLFISMRYVEGSDLREVLRGGRLAVDRAVSICTSVAAALDAAHARGLVHRDVKPANVLVQSTPEHVYVADFGISRRSDARSGATAAGLVGTIDYMAPEQIEGRTVDGRADVYSLGCVAFECLTGQPPFRMENDVAVLWAHMREPPPAASDVERSVPRAVDAVLERALAKDPRERYPSGTELAADLAAALARRRRRRVRPSGGLVPRLRLRRRRGRIAVVAAAALLGAAVATVSTLAVTSRGTRTVVEARPLPRPSAALLRVVPVPMRRSCVRDAVSTPDFDAGLSCTSGDVSVLYRHAVSGARMRAQLLADAVTRGVARFGEPVVPFGRCARTAAAVRDWVGDTPSRRERTPRDRVSTRGRILCFSSPYGWSAVEWTDLRFDVLSTAYGHSAAALYRWWRRTGGPSA